MHVEHTSSQESRPHRKASIRQVAVGVEGLMRLVLLVLIRAYQVVVRPWLIGTCKFYPTCSEYGAEAIQTHGAVRGSLLAIKRVSRCRPFSMGGIDPVPKVVSAPGEACYERDGGDRKGVDAPVRIR